MFDVAIIGAGVIGCSIARELSKYNLNVALIEKENDVGNVTTKANSAIIHAGYDAKPGTLKGKLNAKGNLMFDELCRELEVPFKRVGSLVLAFDDDEMKTLGKLYEQGIQNGVPELYILSKEKVLEMDPNISDNIKGALYAKTGGIIGPWEFTIALAENAVENGVNIFLSNEVVDIEKKDFGYRIITNKDTYDTKYVVNCAGLYADKINNMVSNNKMEIIPRRGQYYLLDKTVGNLVKYVIFQCPSKLGKGVLVTPTVHGNLLIGPDAEDLIDKTALNTTSEGLNFIVEVARRSVKTLPLNMAITNFAGLRARTERDDFIIEEAVDAKGFINVAGIESPGLSSAPAISLYVIDILKNIAKKIEKKENFNPYRRAIPKFIELSEDEKNELVKKDKRFGKIICRCESITEGEIVSAIHRNVGARTVDAVKRRVRAGMGRCQGGFCSPRVIEILARELGVEMTEIEKDHEGSYILTGPTKSEVQ
ncbi:L-2-hydroxyglutarate oxidase LhgO [Caloramator mitchellensis]|uniref:Glycerol 3-phosphate dehydrogenase n=1 Tax=Caloramator mitchellensis TaxID=908809 RepID=GLPDH_CALMK|nr:NAD(P)/FAD-dependent oxidoreductase [Caloramator mitchellensis]A0A0R3K2G2.1 RecName: Full=Glycerol 3-phosphate dehydrogenase [Caloramator mitchellensis]KRQ87604.1 L-2-hydroxyglutarate oxidase LhgO [Caloramator mitchellensis]